MSQSELADRLGITFQQLQKYERGANRTSASRLWQVSKVLGAPVSYFFEGFDGKMDSATDILNTRAGLELVRSYEECSSEVRRLTHQLCKAVASDPNLKPRKQAK